MVDVGAVARKPRQLRPDVNGVHSANPMDVDVRPADALALADYEAFCSEATHAQAQHPIWIRSWIKATGADALIVSVRKEGRNALILALEVVDSGPFRMACFMGGPHANGNFAAVATSGQPFLTASDIAAIREAISKARHDIDLIFLERQALSLNGRENPLAAHATMRSANIALATDLTGGMDAMLGRMSGKRKRKKLRYNLNKFKEAGGHRWIEAGSPAEVEALLRAFFEMKALQFRKRGIPDAFGTQQVQTFFRKLFTDALEHNPAPFALHAVEVGDRIVGVNGYSVTEQSFVCEFCAIDDGEPGLSPGFYLDYVALEKACERGKTIYDFSVGDDDYKRTWCDIETTQFDLLLPLNTKGRVAAATKILRNRAISAVKSNKRVWTLAKKLREKVAGRSD